MTDSNFRFFLQKFCSITIAIAGFDITFIIGGFFLSVLESRMFFIFVVNCFMVKVLAFIIAIFIYEYVKLQTAKGKKLYIWCIFSLILIPLLIFYQMKTIFIQ
jgi:hypothetical protein